MSDWKQITLGDLLTRVRRNVVVEDGGIYPAVSVQMHGRGLGKKEPFVGGVSKYSRLNMVRENDVVLRTITAFEAPVGVARAAHDGTHVSGVFITYEVDQKALPELMGLFFQTPAFWDEMQNRASGTVLRRKTISDASFRAIPFALPPLPTQVRIVEVIGAVDAQVSALGREADALDALLRGRKEELFARYAATATRMSIGEVLEEVKRPITVDPEAEYWQIGIRSHGRGLFTKEAVTGESLGSKKVFWIEPGDLVINIVFAWEGAVAVVPPEIEGYCASHRFPAYRRLDGGDVEFFRLFFSTKTGTRLLASCSPGGAGRNRTLSRKRLMQSPIGMPSAQEQERAICELQALEATVLAVRAEADRLRAVRAGLLSGLLDRTIGIDSAESEV